MAKKDKPTQLPAERPEFPKPLVRLKAEAGGYGCEVLTVADKDAEAGAKDGGWVPLEVPAVPADFVEYPKWLYHEDGRRQVVYTPAEADALEGYTPEVPIPPEVEPYDGVPSPVGDAVAVASKNRPPVPADRG
jgi:hypothetical protein